MISALEAFPSTPMELVSRLTETESTPGTFATAFSTLAWHAAQLMPVTMYCSMILLISLHEFLHHFDKLINRFFLAVPDIFRYAAADMAGQ